MNLKFTTLCLIACAACNNKPSQDVSYSTIESVENLYNPAFTAELFSKIQKGDCEGVEKLISMGANPNGKNSEGKPALLTAIQQNRINIIRLLLESGADPRATDEELVTPFMQVVINKDNLIPKTLEDGSVIQIKPDQKFNKFVADLLLTNGADIHAKDLFQETALMKAATFNNVDAVNYLLEKGAEPNQKNIDGQTPLMIAAKNGFIEVVKSLIKGKADIASSDDEGQTVLIYAVQSKDPEMAKFLISKGALIDAQDVYGATPLKVAQGIGNDQVAQVIIEASKIKTDIAE